MMKILCCCFLFLFFSVNAMAQESDIIKTDRESLAEANESGVSSKIMAAKEQLSDDLNMEEDARRRDLEGITIPLTPDGQGHLLAQVMINNNIPASLVVDTGSPMLTLNSGFVQKLNVDPGQNQEGYVELLNGRYKALGISLDTVKIGEVQAKDVNTALLLEGAPGIGDGLLGMSFLSKFHFTLDQKNQKLILKKLE